MSRPLVGTPKRGAQLADNHLRERGSHVVGENLATGHLLGEAGTDPVNVYRKNVFLLRLSVYELQFRLGAGSQPLGMEKWPQETHGPHKHKQDPNASSGGHRMQPDPRPRWHDSQPRTDGGRDIVAVRPQGLLARSSDCEG